MVPVIVQQRRKRYMPVKAGQWTLRLRRRSSSSLRLATMACPGMCCTTASHPFRCLCLGRQGRYASCRNGKARRDLDRAYVSYFLRYLLARMFLQQEDCSWR